MKLSSKLAEICGIHAGDGHIKNTGREFEISGHVEEKEYYDNRVIVLFNEVFKTNIVGRYFKTKNTYGFWTSNRKIIDELTKLGFPLGAKSQIVKIPISILKSRNMQVKIAFLRGLFDTDGSLTYDKKIKNKDFFKKNYNFYPRIMFSTVSFVLACDVVVICHELGLKCTSYTVVPKSKNSNKKYCIQLAGKEKVERWINLVGFNNFVKMSKYLVWKKLGYCPPFSSLEERINIIKGKNITMQKGP